jgi:hypothetical protein
MQKFKSSINHDHDAASFNWDTAIYFKELYRLNLSVPEDPSPTQTTHGRTKLGRILVIRTTKQHLKRGRYLCSRV